MLNKSHCLCVTDACISFGFIFRLLFEVCQKKSLLSGYKKLLDFLHAVVAYFQGVSICSSENMSVSKNQCAWEVQKTAFAIIGEVYSKVGHSLQVDIWQSTIEVGILLSRLEILSYAFLESQSMVYLYDLIKNSFFLFRVGSQSGDGFLSI